jgi:hypothetical protein
MKLVILVVAAVSAGFGLTTQAQTQTGVFERTLNRCMARSSASIVECAHSSALSTGAEILELKREIDLSTGDMNPQEGDVYECWEEGGGKFCHVYDCSESGNQSICQFVGICHEQDGVSECVPDTEW